MEDKKETYLPIPKCVTVDKSEIHGLGLFATEDIKKGVDLGITHVYDDRFDDGLIRTPLGGFFNHSETPNVEYVDFGWGLSIITISDIKKGDEITKKYTLYNPEK